MPVDPRQPLSYRGERTVEPMAREAYALNPDFLYDDVARYTLPDNSVFVDRISDAPITHKLPDWRPIKIVVVTQEPAAGADVPAGSTVSITTAVRDSLPLDVFEVETAVATKWSTVSAVLDAVEAQPEATKEVITTDKPYQDLSTAEKANADKILTQVFANPASVSVADKAKALDDIRFVYNL